MQIRCVTESVTSGFDALTKAGFTFDTTARFGGLLCRINGKPADDRLHQRPAHRPLLGLLDGDRPRRAMDLQRPGRREPGAAARQRGGLGLLRWLRPQAGLGTVPDLVHDHAPPLVRPPRRPRGRAPAAATTSTPAGQGGTDVPATASATGTGDGTTTTTASAGDRAPEARRGGRGRGGLGRRRRARGPRDDDAASGSATGVLVVVLVLLGLGATSVAAVRRRRGNEAGP